MPSSIQRLVSKARRELQMRPVVPLGAPVKIGHVGVLEEEAFSPRGTTTSDLGLPARSTRVGKPDHLAFTSGQDVKLALKPEGEESSLFPSLPADEKLVEVTLTRKDSFLCAAREVRLARLKDPSRLLQAMRTAYQHGLWRDEYVLVYETAVAKDTLVLAAQSSGTKLALKVTDGLSGPGVPLVDLPGGVQFAAQSHDLVKFEASSAAVFYNAFRVKPEWLTGASHAEVASVAEAWSKTTPFEPAQLKKAEIPVEPV